MIRSVLCWVAMAAAISTSASAQGAETFVDPVTVASAQISPSGSEVALIRRTDDVQQLLVIDIAKKATRVVQSFPKATGYELDWVRWKGDDRLIIGATLEQVKKGRAEIGQLRKQPDEVIRISRVLALGPDGKNAVQMFEGDLVKLWGNRGSTRLLDEMPSDPAHIMITALETSGYGAWKADVATGAVEKVATGSFQTNDYYTDGVGYPVLRIDATASVESIFRRPSGARDWIPAGEIRESMAYDTPEFMIVGPGPDKNKVYVLARHGDADRASLFLYDSATGEFGDPLQTGQEADVSMPWIDPAKRGLMATCEFAARLACRTVDPKLQKYLTALDRYFDKKATVQLVNMSDDSNVWLLRVEMPSEGASYYVFDRAKAQADKLLDIFPGLAGQILAPTDVVSYDARDGERLWAYVTAKPGVVGPRATVVLPHGGPETRDLYGYDSFVQFLAAQGYVVVQPNFRGSGGFGEAFAKAGRGQWGRRMQDDVTDAVLHLIAGGVADPKRVCIVGASYGGYAALAGATLTPELYKCAVSIAGVSDLPAMLKNESTDAGSASNTYHYWRYSIGDPDKDRAALEATSPARLASRVTGPVLLIHGDEDDTVPVRQSVLMHDALRAAGKDSRLVRLPKANHYWDEWVRADRLKLYNETGAFLKQHLN